MFGGPVLAGILSNTFGLAIGFWITGLIAFIGAGLAGWNRYLPFNQIGAPNVE